VLIDLFLYIGMDDMIDPLGDRVMKNVPPISRYPLSRDKLWHISSKSP